MRQAVPPVAAFISGIPSPSEKVPIKATCNGTKEVIASTKPIFLSACTAGSLNRFALNILPVSYTHLIRLYYENRDVPVLIYDFSLEFTLQFPRIFLFALIL